MIKTILYDKRQKHIHKLFISDYVSPYIQKAKGSRISSSIMNTTGYLLMNNVYTSPKTKERYTYSVRMAMLKDGGVILLDESDVLPNYPSDHLVNRMTKLEDIK